MTKNDFKAGYDRLRNVYTNMLELRPGIADEWFSVLGVFSAAEFNDGISGWIANEPYKPVPATLANYCRKARRWRLKQDRVREVREHGVCPWCGGLGFIGRFLEPEDRDRYFYCTCGFSPNPDYGAEILAAALEDDNWQFDNEHHGFRLRQDWIGDEKTTDGRPATAREYARHKEAVARLSRKKSLS